MAKSQKTEHVNLFPWAGSRPEVYAAFQRDFDRDSWIHGLWNLAIIVCAVGAALVSKHPDWLWIFGAIFAAERALTKWVDQSNRNWFMHAIDWDDAVRRD